MRIALEACHKGWGQSIIIGVAGQARKSRRARSSWSPAARGRHRIRRRRGRRDVPKIVEWYMDKKIEIDPLITHTMPLDKINDAFDLMHQGKSIRSVVRY